ncbi:MAG: DUF1566 domain-containing protein [Chlorobiaceae bacterium]|nr:DUF1566 domain-containing protein [Chlorobiaceae bacterium]
MMNIRKPALLYALILAVISTAAAPKISAARPPAIGDSYGGGKIAYILKPGDKGFDLKERHGLIADIADLSGEFDWPDALAASERLKKNGFDDWYLPNKDELNKLHASRTSTGGFTKAGKKDIFYWSSSEKDADYSWGQSFKTGKQYTVDKMTKTGHVRAVRSF